MHHGPKRKMPINIHKAREGPGEDPLRRHTIAYVVHSPDSNTVASSSGAGRLVTAFTISSGPQKLTAPTTTYMVQLFIASRRPSEFQTSLASICSMPRTPP